MPQKLVKVKNKINSSKGKTDVIEKAAREIVAPPHIKLKERDLPFFKSVIAELANMEWTDHTVELAALLARAMSDIEKQQRILRTEGATMIGARGGKIVNPRQLVVDKMASTILSMRRSLALHARAKSGEPRDVGKRRAKAKEIERQVRDIDEEDDDNLINMPGED